MMTLLGILFVVQTCCLPGLLVLYACRVRDLSQVILLAMPVSLTCNYLLFHLFSALDCQSRAAWLLVFVLEVMLLLYVAWRGGWASVGNVLAEERHRVDSWLAIRRKQSACVRWQYDILLFSAFAFLVTFLSVAFYRPGLTTFNQGDDIGNWANWAKQWAVQGGADGIYWYPQLGPIIRAIGFIFVGDIEIHLFSKMTMPLFSVIMVATLIDLGIRLKDMRLLLSASILGGLLWHYAGHYIDSGHMDLPTATMILSSAYPLISHCTSQFGRENRLWSAILVSAMCGMGAVWTKQTGLFVIAVVACMWFWARISVVRQKQIPLYAALTVIFSCLVAAFSFYMPQAQKIISGLDVNNTRTLISLNWKDPMLGNSLLGAFYGHPAFSTLVVFSSMVSLVCKGKYRFLAATLALVGFLCWAALFNYSIRNAFFLFPWVAISFACAVVFLWQHSNEALKSGFRKTVNAVLRIPPVYWLCIVITCSLLVFARIPDSVVYNRQKNANLDYVALGISNQLILDAARFIDPNAKVVVLYYPAALIPETRDRYVAAGLGDPGGRQNQTHCEWEVSIADKVFDTLAAPSNKFLHVETGMLSSLNKKLARVIAHAEQEGVLRRVMGRFNAVLYHYEPQELSDWYAQQKHEAISN
jgi:hypothetical protein